MDGEPVTDATYSDKFMLLYFGFTYCPDICPSELVKMGKVIEKLDQNPQTKDKVVPLFVSLDCKRDSLEQLRSVFCLAIDLTGRTYMWDRIEADGHSLTLMLMFVLNQNLFPLNIL